MPAPGRVLVEGDAVVLGCPFCDYTARQPFKKSAGVAQQGKRVITVCRALIDHVHHVHILELDEPVQIVKGVTAPGG